jgi:hypothetical protein
MREVHMSGKYRPMNYDEYRIPYIDLESAIERIDFSGAEIPLYMQNIYIKFLLSFHSEHLSIYCSTAAYLLPSLQ